MIKRICGSLYLDANYKTDDTNIKLLLNLRLGGIIKGFKEKYERSLLFYHIDDLSRSDITFGILIYGEGSRIKNDHFLKDIIYKEFPENDENFAIRSMSFDVFDYDRFE